MDDTALQAGTGDAPANHTRRRFLSLGASALGLTLTGCARTRRDGRPNILLIITDDQRFDTVEPFMPRTAASIFGSARFPNAYVTTPLCNPSRASILTGRYASRHGATRQRDALNQPTFVNRLHDAGYHTGLIGKYLNSWDGSPRPEFAFWASLGSSQPYINPTFNVNGAARNFPGYVTGAFTTLFTEFLSHEAVKTKPFALIVAPNIPHLEDGPATPPPGGETLFQDLPPYRPANFNPPNLPGKPTWLRDRALLSHDQVAENDVFRLHQARSLHALDAAIGEMYAQLTARGKRDDTVIFYMSDNGYMWGEHRLVQKEYVYEPSIRIPFGVHYPRASSRTFPQIVANIDVAPTIYELAQLPIPPEVDGRSLVPLLEGKSDWRDAFRIEGWPKPKLAPPYTAIHTARHVYVETEGDIPELYDLETDPDQLVNLAGNPKFADVEGDLKRKLAG